jgi:ParB family chromosome partitioning protein
MGKARYTDKVSESMRGMITPVSAGRASIGQEQRVGEYFYIQTNQLVPFADQARVHFDEKELGELKQSIETHGVIQPLQVIKSQKQDGFYEVISGERRLRAANLLNMERVPCIIIKDAEKKHEIAIIENIQRSDLHPLELARAYADLLIIKQTQAAVAESLGISPQSVSETLKLLEIPKTLQDELIEKNVRSRDTLRRIVKEKALPTTLKAKRSVLRVSLFQNTLSVQRTGLERLTPQNRKVLIGILTDLMGELENLK